MAAATGASLSVAELSSFLHTLPRSSLLALSHAAAAATGASPPPPGHPDDPLADFLIADELVADIFSIVDGGDGSTVPPPSARLRRDDVRAWLSRPGLRSLEASLLPILLPIQRR